MASSAVVGLLRVLLTANTAEFQSAMKSAADSAKLWTRDLNQIGRQATAVGASLTKTLTLPLLAVGVGAAKAAIDFESSFAGVRKTVTATEAEFAKLSQGFRDLSKVIPINVNELNKIGEAAGQLGIKKENILGFTEVMAKLGVTTNLAADEAATMLARFDNITTGGAQQTFAELGSTIVSLGNNLATTEREIVEMSMRLAGAGRQIGLTQADILSLGGALSSLGLEAEAGGTAFSRVMIEMQNAVLDGGAKLELFKSVAGETFQKTFKEDAAQAINEFIGGLARMSEEGKNINPVLKELGLGGLRVSDSLRRTGNAVERVTEAVSLGRQAWRENTALTKEAEERFKTTASQLTLLWNRIQDVGVTIGNALLPAIKGTVSLLGVLMPVAEGIAHVFGAMPAPLQMIAIGLAAAVAATGPLIWAFGQLALSAGAITTTFAAKGIATRLLTANVGLLSKAYALLLTPVRQIPFAAAAAGAAKGTLAGVTATLTGAVHGLKAAILALPWAAAAAGAALLAGALVKLYAASKERALAAETEGAKQDTINRAIERGAGFWKEYADATDKYAASIKFLQLTEDIRLAQYDKSAEAQQKRIAAELTLGRITQEQANTQLLAIGVELKANEVRGKRVSLAESLKQSERQIQEEIKATGTSMADMLVALKTNEAGFKKWADSVGLTAPTIAFLESQLKSSTKAVKDSAKAATDAEKAAEKHAAMLAKQADALEKLGVVTENQVLKSLAEYNELVEHATAAGVPLDHVLAALSPKLEELSKTAKASGLDMQQFGTLTKEASDALIRLNQNAIAGIIEGMPAVRNGLEGLPPVIGQLVTVSSAADIEARNLTESYKFFGISTRAELLNTARAAVAHYTAIEASGTATPEAIRKAFEQMNDALRAAGLKTQTLWKDVFSGIASGAAAAFSSGGLKGLANFGTNVAQEFTAEVLSWIPGIGTAISQLAGPLVDGIGKVFKNIFGGTAGRDAMRSFFAEMGGEAALRAQLTANVGAAEAERLMTQLYRTGRDNAKQAAANIQAVTDALEQGKQRTAEFNATLGGTLQKIRDLGGQIPDALRPYLEGLRNAGRLTEDNIALLAQLSGEGEVDWKIVSEAVQRYGGDIEQLGGSFQNARMHEAWQQVIDDIDLFQRSNIATHDILDLTDEKIGELVQQSRKFGTEIPENMRPWIEKLIEAGELVAENGEKITDIGQLKFGETLQTSIQTLTDAIRDLIDQFNKVPEAANRVPSRIRTTVQVDYETGEVPEPPLGGGRAPTAATGGLVVPSGIRYLAEGGFGSVGSFWKPKGTDTVPAMLTPGELILNEGQQSNIATALQHALALAKVQAQAPAYTGGVSTTGTAAATPAPSSVVQTFKADFHLHTPIGELDTIRKFIDEEAAPRLIQLWEKGGAIRTKTQEALGLS